ncbi:peptide chain release factor N(5)-glutamine methyltransferase [Roseivirga misakiensis]|uniref:peptide chain release factor N(5)-glutamine methyltransferase n=1 Tax=Roseivirga misakiensis TaxID=1563681 RepID=A0A1E5T388_9BACT|nr:peptide chain release factor N(5)-glutamine methyltransferase [Roseivirga misakiensis]OEK05849.1 protein-(glutamine-N5) methyltransferase, release factor-specific [Roseivirga misakiensis]
MQKAKSKNLLLEIQERLEAIYGDRESLSIAKHYLLDRHDVNAIDLTLNKEITFLAAQFENDLNALSKGVPYQHVVGFTYFLNHKFETNANALIPRPETEELVDWIIKGSLTPNPVILDIGTGTGCIPISLKLALANSSCTGFDVSLEALELALKNAKNLRAEVNFESHDILQEDLKQGEYDIIVSNPPYIPQMEKSNMHENVTAHEPEIALFVPDNDPLLFYRNIAEKSLFGLKKGGHLYFEIHENYGLKTQKLLVDLGYSAVTLKKDLQGKDRMISAQKSS